MQSCLTRRFGLKDLRVTSLERGDKRRHGCCCLQGAQQEIIKPGHILNFLYVHLLILQKLPPLSLRGSGSPMPMKTTRCLGCATDIQRRGRFMAWTHHQIEFCCWPFPKTRKFDTLQLQKNTKLNSLPRYKKSLPPSFQRKSSGTGTMG